ncbi:Ground-like domain-containing protein [Caenorhabditis elegans]|uniref:Ground-like domain-containing protein n=1 Tax=Caenorhabditis elegans TaxID=6239 RepID=Q9U3J9_CAEEL|nr:Ground-like domain-containing protein [Caenorhabditis elegans]CAB62799.1 Ground-like domain-containing protein [Caenorhabditis elegans]|eukprot:NP_503117.1 GRound-Like (grd related) [Caenorhabditis elegans]
MSSLLLLLVLVMFFTLASCQDDNFEGERCNDVILYDIIKKASKKTDDPVIIRRTSMDTMQNVFPLARSMGCICTDRNFQFPDFTNHRYCSVRVSNFRCHAIVF